MAQPYLNDDAGTFKPIHAGRVFVGDQVKTDDGTVWTVDKHETMYRLTLTTPGREPRELLIPAYGVGNEVLHRKGTRSRQVPA